MCKRLELDTDCQWIVGFRVVVSGEPCDICKLIMFWQPQKHTPNVKTLIKNNKFHQQLLHVTFHSLFQKVRSDNRKISSRFCFRSSSRFERKTREKLTNHYEGVKRIKASLVTLEGNKVLSRSAFINIKINLLLKKHPRAKPERSKTFSFALRLFSYHLFTNSRLSRHSA